MVLQLQKEKADIETKANDIKDKATRDEYGHIIEMLHNFFEPMARGDKGAENVLTRFVETYGKAPPSSSMDLIRGISSIMSHPVLSVASINAGRPGTYGATADELEVLHRELSGIRKEISAMQPTNMRVDEVGNNQALLQRVMNIFPENT